MKIILDVDGVIAQCHETALKYHGVRLKDYPLNQDVKDLIHEHRPECGVDELTRDEFWAAFNYDFWAGLPRAEYWLPFWTYLDSLVGLENVFVATRPALSGECAAGKFDWLTFNLPKGVNFALIHHKSMLARVDRLLIDDSPKNVEEFRRAGGSAFLWKQPWNGHRVPYATQLCELAFELGRQTAALIQ